MSKINVKKLKTINLEPAQSGVFIQRMISLIVCAIQSSTFLTRYVQKNSKLDAAHTTGSVMQLMSIARFSGSMDVSILSIQWLDFWRLSRVPERIVTEHTHMKNSLESKLKTDSSCSISIRFRNWDWIEKTLFPNFE